MSRVAYGVGSKEVLGLASFISQEHVIHMAGGVVRPTMGCLKKCVKEMVKIGGVRAPLWIVMRAK